MSADNRALCELEILHPVLSPAPKQTEICTCPKQFPELKSDPRLAQTFFEYIRLLLLALLGLHESTTIDHTHQGPILIS